MTVVKIVPMPGVPGPKGDAGDRGPQGLPGENGLSGASAYQIAVGNGFSGTEQQWLASLVGPQGDRGLPGSVGPTGLSGASAYQIALSNGFVGSEEDWLASLVGPQGEVGPQGIQGEVGPQGPAGETATKGTWSPSWTGTGLVYTGNPVTGNYMLVGDLVYFRMKFSLTEVSSFGTGAYSVTLPFAPIDNHIFRNGVIKSGSTNYNIYLSCVAGSNVASIMYGAGNQDYAVDYNSPKTFITSDVIYISGTYERAV